MTKSLLEEKMAKKMQLGQSPDEMVPDPLPDRLFPNISRWTGWRDLKLTTMERWRFAGVDYLDPEMPTEFQMHHFNCDQEFLRCILAWPNRASICLMDTKFHIREKETYHFCQIDLLNCEWRQYNSWGVFSVDPYTHLLGGFKSVTTMLQLILSLSIPFLPTNVNGFWDLATTTIEFDRWDMESVRRSFFRWQRPEWNYLEFWIPYWDWEDIRDRRMLCSIAGLSIDMLPLGPALLINQRAVLTSANYLDRYTYRQKDLRIWALGRGGQHDMPYRYRVWRFRRLLPKSLNPEHWHGARGVHSPRHDVTVVHSMDQMYIYYIYPDRFTYPCRGWVGDKKTILTEKNMFAGTGFEYMEHIQQNYKIFYGRLYKDEVVNCEIYLPKWWGKFMCFWNHHGWAGVPNGGPLYNSDRHTIAIGCFEIRYNDDRIMVFTDLRYYYDWLYMMANMTLYEYYEYAYPQWSVRWGWIYDGNTQTPYIPFWQLKSDLWPLGK